VCEIIIEYQNSNSTAHKIIAYDYYCYMPGISAVKFDEIFLT